jgi:hypothetical protein
MSTPLKSNSWQDRLVSSKGELPTLKQQKLIEENFYREDIFSHKYNVNDLFEQFYKVSPENSQNKKPKRQPNSFMILRAVLGLVARDKCIKSKIGDGTEQSKLASFIWGGANENEKTKFEELCSEFKKLHQQLYPNYVYKPTPRNTKVGSVVDIKTAESFQSLGISTGVSAPMDPVEQQTFQHMETNASTHHTYYRSLMPLMGIEEEIEIVTNELDQNTFFEGYFPYVNNNNNNQQTYSSISVNCPPVDPNDSLKSPFNFVDDPFTPHFATNRYAFENYGFSNQKK